MFCEIIVSLFIRHVFMLFESTNANALRQKRSKRGKIWLRNWDFNAFAALLRLKNKRCYSALPKGI